MVLPKLAKVWTGREILALPLTHNAQHASTIRDWLVALLADAVYGHGVLSPYDFNLADVRAALCRAGVVDGEFDDVGVCSLADVHERDKANEAVQLAIKALGERP